MVVEGDQFCHIADKISCFGDFDPSKGNLRSIQKIIENKQKNVETASYTNLLLNEGYKINAKILETANSLVSYSLPNEIIEKSSDLFYYSLLYLTKNKLSVDDVEKELIKRRYSLLKSQLKCVIGDENILAIGIVGSHHDINQNIEFLSKFFNCQIKLSSDVRNYLIACDNPKYKFIFVKPKDIQTLIINGFIDAILSFEDMILNSSLKVEKIQINNIETKKKKQKL